MKIQIAFPIALLILGPCSIAVAQELPSQKPGLWQITMSGAKVPGGTRSYKMCQDAASIAAAKSSAAAHMKNDCGKNSIRNVGDTWTTDVECTMSGMHIVSHSEMTVHGDETFHTQLTSTLGTAKPMLPQSQISAH